MNTPQLKKPTIDINICIPNHFIKRVKVSPLHKISILNNLFPQEDNIFIYRGQLLSENSTFESYGFGRNDQISVQKYYRDNEVGNGGNNSNKSNARDQTKEKYYIVVLPNLQTPEFEYYKLKWIQITRDADIFSENIAYGTGKASSREFARLRDLRMTKLEQKKSFYRKNWWNFIDNKKLSAKRDVPLVTDFKQLDTPCSEAMPVIW
ncbi:hypothetical protein TRFO_01032 [Tritrichomonas foetus]|uniref:Ubiquitin-like domain-containing protein n=1 Tax=Tritrichomonas foetus TaxID=1144522 RepID=A0A1J4KIG6_9EUKA|nr:hypothetical protein TRFO_01032 [Tritrichomonas foetus]|eukprot:OHT11143.1 hypothetical protein TRFO_01032 [Tritrichomonas foetus]